MTPDEVVERARELEGEEVLLTFRGVVRRSGDNVWIPRGSYPVHIASHGEADDDLEDIRPAPMRIVKGQRYADAQGRLFEGDTDGGLWELAAGYILAGEVGELDGLRPVRVVDQ